MTSNTKQVHRAIARVIKLNQTHRGIVAAVTDALFIVSRKAQHRQEVGVWLHPEPGKRIEPRLTTGLHLAAACEAVLARHRKQPFQRKEAK